MAFHLEICVDSADSAVAASQSGATRIELCSNLVIGGTTPPVSLIELTRELVQLPIHVLIRPRFGDFLYTPFEFEQMKRDIITCRKHMVDGVVIGALTANGQLDAMQLSTLIDLADDMHVTLHRAFDLVKDPFEALETAQSLGIQTILTSGQKASAPQGNTLLRQLVEKAGDNLTIMPGAGIHSSNLEDLIKTTKAHAYHLSAKQLIPSLMTYHHPDVSMGLPGITESIVYSIAEDEVRACRHILDTCLQS